MEYFRWSRDKCKIENYFKETYRSEWYLWPGEKKIGANLRKRFYQFNKEVGTSSRRRKERFKEYLLKRGIVDFPILSREILLLSYAFESVK